MDIKQRIQELSLDQKAKLYYMMLLRKGVIDTLPEDPKAAYVQSMMDEPASSKFSEPMGDKDDYGRSVSGKDKSTFMEPEDMTMAARARKMAGMEENKNPNLKSMSDVDNTGWTPDGGGGSIGYMEWEDGTEMTPQEIQDYFEANHELYDDIMQGLYETNDPEDDEEQAEYDKGWYGESLKEAASKLGYLNEESNQYQKVTFIYTEQGGHFYGLDVYVSKDQPQRSAKLKYDEANEWVKDTLGSFEGVKATGIDELIPRRYNSGMEDLDLIVERLEELDIEASHGDYMDVS